MQNNLKLKYSCLTDNKQCIFAYVKPVTKVRSLGLKNNEL